MWIRYRFEKSAGIMSKIIVPFTLCTVFFIFTVGVYVNLFVFQLITFQMVIAGFLVAGAGYLFGGTLAWLFRLKLPQIKAVSIETAFQARLLFFKKKLTRNTPKLKKSNNHCLHTYYRTAASLSSCSRSPCLPPMGTSPRSHPSRSSSSQVEKKSKISSFFYKKYANLFVGFNFTGAPLWIFLGIWKVYERFCRRKKPVMEPIQVN